MKRILVAVSLAALAVPAFAAEVSAPYEQAQIDRQLPDVQRSERASDKSTSAKTQGNVWANDYNFIAPAL
jgi:opacity protein-like surface antigen